MRFITKSTQVEKKFSLVYRDDDYSFDIEPLQDNGFTSILINDLQLEINDEGRVLYVWGLCPLVSYQETDQVPQNYRSEDLMVLLDKAPIPGISYTLNKESKWPIHINKEKGWVCIGNPKSQNLVEFAPNCIAALKEQDLVAVWLHPKKLPNFR